MTKVIDQSDPETFRALLHERDTNYIRSFWEDWDRSKTGILSRDEAEKVLYAALELHWSDEIADFSPDQKHHLIVQFCDLADKKVDGTISLENLLSAFKIVESRCYFSGSREILLINNIGRELKAAPMTNEREHLIQQSINSYADYQQLLDSFLSVDSGSSCAVPLSGKLSLFTPGELQY